MNYHCPRCEREIENQPGLAGIAARMEHELHCAMEYGKREIRFIGGPSGEESHFCDTASDMAFQVGDDGDSLEQYHLERRDGELVYAFKKTIKPMRPPRIWS